MVGLIVGKTGTMFHLRRYLEKATLPTILSKYKLDEIYNADEFGLFFRMQPNKSLNLRSEACTGGKHSKIRLTGMATANATVDKISMFVIGKSKSPRCFKGVKYLLCRHRNQNMDSVWIAEWIAYYLKSGYGKWIQNLQKRRKK